MNNIDPQATRSSFFPNSKTQNSKKMRQLDNVSLKRNDTSRLNELKQTTMGDAKVNISDAIKDFSRIKKAVDMAPPIDNSAKIAMLKGQIKNGTYKPNYEAIADKVLREEM